MFSFKLGSLLALATLVVAQADPSINSPPAVVQCQPVQLSWTATKTPVFISIIPGGQPGATPYMDFGSQPADKKTLTWTADVPAGWPITFQIRDSAGAVAYSATMTVQDSSDASCVDPNLPEPSSTGPAGGTSTPAGTASAPGSSASAATPAPSVTAPASSTRTAAAATSATPTPSAAASNAARVGAAVQFGWTGVLGLFAIAGFAAA